MIKLIHDAGTVDKEIDDIIQEVSSTCDVCKRFKKPPLHPVVGFPLASTLNETVAMDLKTIDGRLVLHMIDHATRFSAACVVRNKEKETIVRGILEYWVRIFGSPGYFLFDNGGEFVNEDLIEFACKFNVTIRTTAAESPWSNGLCERHNGILADLVSGHVHKKVGQVLKTDICSFAKYTSHFVNFCPFD